MARGQPIDFDTMPGETGAEAPTPVAEAAAPSGRDTQRASSRQPTRMFTPIEPHLRYELHPHEIPADMEAQWVVLSVKGAPGPNLGRYYQNGWMPALAKDYPRLSGFGIKYPDQLIRAGLIKETQDDDPVLDDDKSQILMVRPKEYGVRAEAARRNDAVSLVETQMDRLQLHSRRHIRDRTEFRRQHVNASAELAQAGGEI